MMPFMPPLPNSRVSRSDPFTYTGVDYSGPLYIKTKNREPKGIYMLGNWSSTFRTNTEHVNSTVRTRIQKVYIKTRQTRRNHL